MNRIIYKNNEGGVSVIIPTPEALEQHGIESVALKDVPAGKKFKIIDASDLPTEPQETWVVDEADLTDGVGGVSSEFEVQP
jgi:hypothetical protein